MINIMNLLQFSNHENGEIAARIPVWLFKISFCTGTLLLVLGMLFRKCDPIILIGFFYTIIAFAVNAIAFVVLIILSFVFRTHSYKIRFNTALLLVNIPIAVLYVSIISGIAIFN
jgi:hypothetical protein